MKPSTVTPPWSASSSLTEPMNIVRQALPAAAGGAIRGGVRPAKAVIGGDTGGGGGGGGGGGSGLGSSPMVSRGGVGAIRAPSPARSSGLQVQTQAAEAAEMFITEELSPSGHTSIFASHTASDTSGRRTPPSRDRAAEAAALLEGGTSVAARVGTWPPASPANTRAWARRTETAVTPRFATPKVALAPSPAATPKRVNPAVSLTSTPRVVPKTPAPPASSPSSSSIPASTLPVAPIVSSTRPSHQPASSSEDIGVLTLSQGGTGIVSGGGASAGVDAGRRGGGVGSGGGRKTGGVAAVGGGDGQNGATASGKGDEADSAVDDKEGAGGGEEEKVSGPTKACEANGCMLEACWGDPRFRPRYCARHKKQGNKLMDPVEQEEGDKAAEPVGLSPPAGRSPSPEALPGVGDAAAVASAVVGGGDERSTGSPSPFAAMVSAGQTPPVLVEAGRDAVATNATAQRAPRPGHQSTAAPAAYDSGRNIPLGTRVRAATGGPGTETEEEGLEDDEDEDEGWDNGDGGAGGAVVELNGTGGPGMLPAALQALQAEVVHNRRESLEDYTASGCSDVDGDVQARVATFGRLAKKSQPGQKQPKASHKSKKRGSGNNIADFYGGGESESDDDEQSFNMDSYSKGVLLSQAAEVGTHTEDGQLRPQPSQERDQQRLAHLVRVGKLGSALRGKGVSAVGKRR